MTKEVMEHLRNKVIESGATNVVIGDLPSLVMNCAAIKPIDGYKSTYYFGRVSSAEPLIECIIRNQSYEIGQQLYTQVGEALDKYSAEEVGISSVFLTGSPGYLGADENGFNEWHMLFHVTIF